MGWAEVCMGLMEKESGGLCFIEAPVPFCKSYSFFLSSLISISCICVKYLSHYHTPLSCPLGCLAAEFYFFIYFYLFVVYSDSPLFHVGYASSCG